MKKTQIQNIHYRSQLGIIFAIFGWGLSTTFIDFGLKFINPLPFLTLRFIIATIIIIPFMIRTCRINLNKLAKNKLIWFIGISETFGLILQYLGQQFISAGLTSLLTMMNILIIPILSFKVLNERFNVHYLLVLILGLIGVFLIVTEGNVSHIQSTSYIGILLLIGSTVSYAFYQVLTARYTKTEKDVDSFSLFFIILVVISVSSLVISLFLMNFEVTVFLDFKSEAWLWIFLLAIFSTIIAFTGHIEATKDIPANMISILLLIQLLIPVLIDFFILKVSYNLWTLVGGGIIVLAILILIKIPSSN